MTHLVAAECSGSTKTIREKIKVVAELTNEGKTYREIARLLGYQSEGSVSRIMRDAKAQGLINDVKQGE